MDRPSLSPPRRTHRKRFSVVRLSSDTTATLPEYSSTPWQRPSLALPLSDDLPSDRPPDYPESADEADAESDDSIAPRLPSASPIRSRTRQHYTPRRRAPEASTSDLYLDSLLERSVHALEMSNTLLQSSMSTQTSLSALLSSDDAADRSLEARARGLSRRMRNSGMHREHWIDDLHETSRGVDGLVGEGGDGGDEDVVSRSLPTAGPRVRLRHPAYRSSTDLHAPDMAIDESQLRLSQWDRSRLVARAPRALTQYIESSADPDVIQLPSTLGLRASASAHPHDRLSSSTSDLPSPAHFPASASAPTLTDRGSEPSTPAYTMLSSFLSRRSSAGSSSRSRSVSTQRTASADLRSPHLSPERRRRATTHSRSPTPKRSASPSSHTHFPRSMTPPLEELSASSGNSSDPHPNPVLSLQALRRILDEQPPSADPKGKARAAPEPPPPKKRAPAFLPRTPAPIAVAGTSTATASISRLFTKASHSASTRAPSPPRASALKGSTPRTPLSPTTPAGPSASASASASGASTPKRISFAELPESYAGARGGAGSGRGFHAKGNRKGKGKGKGDDTAKRQGADGDSSEGGEGGWWVGWLLGAAGTRSGTGMSMSGGRPEERVEARMARSWSGRAGLAGGMEDWAV